MTDIPEEFEALGRIWFRRAISASAVESLRAHTVPSGKPGQRYAADDRLVDILKVSGLAEVLQDIWPSARLRRIVAFDKSSGVNWQLPWHQDRVIAVQDRMDMEDFTRWSRKAGVWHCEPPLAVLQRMLFVRLHLDHCDHSTGAMEIALGSHLEGKMSKADIANRIDEFEHEVTLAEPGDVLVMSMLMVHRSPAATTPGTRRVLRLDYGTGSLPTPLNWAI